LGDGTFSYFDDNSHTSQPARGVVFQVYSRGKSFGAKLLKQFVEPNKLNSLCTGSFRKSDLENYVAGWGCSLDAITLFDKDSNPIVSLSKIETPETQYLYPHSKTILNGVDWGPALDYALSYRVIPLQG
jgi:hypothetical protein